MRPIPISLPVGQYVALRSEINAVVEQVLSSGSWLNGPWTGRFEQEFATWCAVNHCVLVSNGTDALELAMRALGIGAGDEVVTVANAGGYATTACRLVGATPVWVDVRADTLGIDPSRIADAITDATRLVVVTHLYGIAADVAALRANLDRIGRGDVRILEDCAQAHGAMRDQRKVGSLGDIGTFSFYPTKNLGAIGDAGAVVTNSAEIAERIVRLRQYGWTAKYVSALPYGRNSRIDELQAAILSVKLPHVDAWNARRRHIVTRYADEIAPPNEIVGAREPSNVGHLAVLRTSDRRTIITALGQAGIATDVHYPVLDCDQVSQQGLPGRKLSLSVSERARDEILTLPCYPELSDDDVGMVIAAINNATSASKNTFRQEPRP
jgi:dTDP-4-amino-4,6-dideoxygalactose transaminase